jgi:hypothetical protein
VDHGTDGADVRPERPRRARDLLVREDVGVMSHEVVGVITVSIIALSALVSWLGSRGDSIKRAMHWQMTHGEDR